MHVPVYLMKGGIIQILLSFLCEQKFLLQLSDNEAIQKKKEKKQTLQVRSFPRVFGDWKGFSTLS